MSLSVGLVATPINDESEIVWLISEEEKASLPYAREAVFTASQRKSAITLNLLGWDASKYKIVAYAKLNSDAPNNGRSGYFNRRFWFIKDYDISRPGTPLESVYQLSIRANKNSNHFNSNK